MYDALYINSKNQPTKANHQKQKQTYAIDVKDLTFENNLYKEDM